MSGRVNGIVGVAATLDGEMQFILLGYLLLRFRGIEVTWPAMQHVHRLLWDHIRRILATPPAEAIRDE